MKVSDDCLRAAVVLWLLATATFFALTGHEMPSWLVWWGAIVLAELFR
jgi:hypothetical protein